MKLLVISLAGIGDSLFATPLIHELRENFPDATLDAFVLWRGARDLLEGNPHLNRVHQRNLIAESKPGALRFLLGLRRESYDVSFNTHPQSRIHYRVVARIIGARIRIGHSYDNASLLDSLLAHRSLPQDYARHAIENNLALLDLFGVRPKLDHHSYELFLTPAEHEWAERFVMKQELSGKTLLGIHVGSGGTKNLALRRWPLANYIALINRLTRAHPDVNVLLFGGPDAERDHIRVLAETDSTRVFQPRTQNFRQAAALVKKCSAFLSVDTALMHIAAAMRVPGQVVIETPSWNKPIEPHGNPFTLVKNPAVAGRNLEFYRYDGHGIKGTNAEIRRCMESVTVESVFEAVTRNVTRRV
jgi:ADP-heptose:LPS heptosyltransferase